MRYDFDWVIAPPVTPESIAQGVRNILETPPMRPDYYLISLEDIDRILDGKR